MNKVEHLMRGRGTLKLYKSMFVKFAKHLPDSLYLRLVFYTKLKMRLNLSSPKSYNEKVNWLKLHDRKNEYHEMVDKYDAKQYVARLVGKKYTIPTYGVWDRFDQIDFSALPDRFVLKTTHDSGGVVLVRDKEKMDVAATRKKLEESLANNYYYLCREWPYKDIKHRIIAEELICNEVPDDYKFFMFNGEMDSVMVCTDRASGHPKFRFYNKNWKRLYYQKDYLEPESNVEKPENFEEMVQLAHTLAKGFVHVRVDLYNINGRVLFGELTLYDQGGFDTDITYETDLAWGAKMDLTQIKDTV